MHESSKTTILPISLAIAETYVAQPQKLPWYVDLLNLNLNVSHLNVARDRSRVTPRSFAADGTRVTENLDFA